MNKKLLFLEIILILLFPILVNASNKKILQIGNNIITEDDVKLKEIQIENLFKQKYHRLPTTNDNKDIESIQLNYQKLKLFKVASNLIMKEVRNKYYDKIIKPEVIAKHLDANKRNINDDINRDTMFLAAVDYVKKSEEKDKYEIAYKKYRKLGMENSYDFFKSAVNNEKYLELLRSRIRERSTNGISQINKDRIFEQRLFDYIVNELGEKDKEIKEHLRLAEKHGCNYKDLLYIQWFIDQGNKMGVEIFDLRYGHSLKDILNPHMVYAIINNEK